MSKRYYVVIEPAERRHTDETIRRVPVINGDTVEQLHQMQEIVRGHIEVVPGEEEGMGIICNEVGRLMKMRKNKRASLLTGLDILGPVLVVQLVSRDGETALVGFDDLTSRQLCYRWKRPCV